MRSEGSPSSCAVRCGGEPEPVGCSSLVTQRFDERGPEDEAPRPRRLGSLATGLAGGSGDGLGLGGAALAKEDAQHDERADREELGLPVLQRLEPELRTEQVAQGRDTRLAGGYLLGAVRGGAGDEMAEERQDEQAEQGDAQRVLVDPEREAAMPDRPGGVRVGLVAAGVLVEGGVTVE